MAEEVGQKPGTHSSGQFLSTLQAIANDKQRV